MLVFLLMSHVGSKRMDSQVSLREECWGTVNVCRDGKCGGVCRDTWRNEDSKMICTDLGCGDQISKQLQFKINKPPVTYHSVYCSEKVLNMKMCLFIPNNDSTCNTPAQVICTGNVNSWFIQDQKMCYLLLLVLVNLGLVLLFAYLKS